MNENTELVPIEEVKKTLHTEHRVIVKAMLNGTLPIGMAVEPEGERGKYCAKVIRARWEKWLKGEL